MFKPTRQYKICKSCGKQETLWGRARSENCTECNYKKNYARFKSVRRPYNLKRSYNLTVEDFDSMVKLQSSKCAICDLDIDTKEFAVDHNHETGKVRGLLCHPCNRGLGQFKDKLELLIKATNYLRDRN